MVPGGWSGVWRPPQALGAEGASPGPEPLSDQEKPRAPKIRFFQTENTETAPDPARRRGPISRDPARHPHPPAQLGVGVRAAQGCGVSRGTGLPLGQRGSTHRPAAGVPDVAIGEGLVDGEPKVSPPDVAHHLAVSPDGLQAEHGHFSGRSKREGWGPGALRRGTCVPRGLALRHTRPPARDPRMPAHRTLWMNEQSEETTTRLRLPSLQTGRRYLGKAPFPLIFP